MASVPNHFYPMTNQNAHVVLDILEIAVRSNHAYWNNPATQPTPPNHPLPAQAKALAMPPHPFVLAQLQVGKAPFVRRELSKIHVPMLHTAQTLAQCAMEMTSVYVNPIVQSVQEVLQNKIAMPKIQHVRWYLTKLSNSQMGHADMNVNLVNS